MWSQTFNFKISISSKFQDFRKIRTKHFSCTFACYDYLSTSCEDLLYLKDWKSERGWKKKLWGCWSTMMFKVSQSFSKIFCTHLVIFHYKKHFISLFRGQGAWRKENEKQRNSGPAIPQHFYRIISLYYNTQFNQYLLFKLHMRQKLASQVVKTSRGLDNKWKKTSTW